MSTPQQRSNLILLPPAPFPRAESIVMWLNASQIYGVGNNGALSSWTDISGNGRTVSQATGANQPTYKTNVINGLPAVYFDGSRYLTHGVNSSQPITFFVAFSYSSGKANPYLFDSAQTPELYAVFYSQSLTIGAGKACTFGNVLYDTWSIGTFMFDGANSVIDINGTTVTGDVGTGSQTGFNLAKAYTADGDTGAFLIGNIAEVIQFSAALDKQDRRVVRKYLSDKYNIAIS